MVDRFALYVPDHSSGLYPPVLDLWPTRVDPEEDRVLGVGRDKRRGVCHRRHEAGLFSAEMGTR
jgi:hypothetical protein